MKTRFFLATAAIVALGGAGTALAATSPLPVLTSDSTTSATSATNPASSTVTYDIPGNCDEAEHVNDDRCTGITIGTDSSQDDNSRGDNSQDDNSRADSGRRGEAEHVYDDSYDDSYDDDDDSDDDHGEHDGNHHHVGAHD